MYLVENLRIGEYIFMYSHICIDINACTWSKSLELVST